MTEHATLEPVDAADVTIVVDNSIDLLMPNERAAQRAPLHHDWSERDQLIAEHGYSLLLTIQHNGQAESILYDAGLGRRTAIHNLDVLGLTLRDVRTVVLSHGHADHHGGLEGLFDRVGRRGMPLVLHPDAWLERRVVFPTGLKYACPRPATMISIERAGRSSRNGTIIAPRGQSAGHRTGRSCDGL